MTEDLTPKHLRCGFGSCPSVHRLDDGRLRIVGRIAEPHEMNGANRGDDEEAVVISPNLLGTLIEEKVREATVSRLQSLTEENERLREALKPFVDAYDFYAPEEQDNKPDEDHAYASEFNMGDLRRAQAALSTTDDQ